MDLAEKKNKTEIYPERRTGPYSHTKTIPNISEKGHFSYSSPI
jgi:hypothetical protein